MNKKQLYLTTLLGLTMLPVAANAETLDNLSQQSKLVEQQLEQAKNSKVQTEQELNNIIEEITQIDNNLKTLNLDILTARNRIQEREREIKLLETKIYYLKLQVEAKERELQAKEQDIAKTLRAMYSRGDVSMLEFLFRSDSISQFINRLDAYKKIANSHEKIYDEVKIALKAVQKDKDDLENKESKLKNEKYQLEQEKMLLESKQLQVSSLKQQMEDKESQMQQQLSSEKEVINQLILETEELEMQMAQERKRIEDEKNKKTFEAYTTPIINGNDVIDIAYKWAQLRGLGSSNPVEYSMPKRQLNLSTYGDCSAFTRRVFLDAGKGDIGLTTAQQIVNPNGYFSTNIHEMVPGDLMYFGPTGNHRHGVTLPNGQSAAVAHVAIYIGNGKMIDLSSGVGTISIKNFSSGSKWESYVNTRFIGFKRF